MKSLKRVVTIIGVLFILLTSADARLRAIGNLARFGGQEESTAQARKFDEYELNRASIGDMKARLDGFFQELQKEPSSQAYIFIYGQAGGSPLPGHSHPGVS